MADPARPFWPQPPRCAERVVYVPIEELAACAMHLGKPCQMPDGTATALTPDVLHSTWRRNGDRLDAYVLNGPEWLSAGIRYGAQEADYLSPYCSQDKLRELLNRQLQRQASGTGGRAPGAGHLNRQSAWTTLYADIVEGRMVHYVRLTPEFMDVEAAGRPHGLAVGNATFPSLEEAAAFADSIDQFMDAMAASMEPDDLRRIRERHRSANETA